MFPMGGLQQPHLQPYQSSISGPLAQGIANLVTGFQQGKLAAKKKAEDEFYKGVQLMMQGIPVNKEDLLKKAQKAGLPLDFREPDQIPSQQGGGQQQAPPPQDATGGADLQNTGMPPMQGPPPTPGAPPQGAQPPQGPGFWGGISQKLGMSRSPIGPNSPAMQGLDRVMAMAQQKQQMEQMIGKTQMGKMQQEQMQTMAVMAAMQGDPKAQDMVRGVATSWQPTQIQQYKELIKQSNPGMTDREASARLWSLQSGEQENKLHMMKLEQEYAKMSFDQFVKMQEVAGKFDDRFKGAPPQLTQTLAYLSLTGKVGGPEYIQLMQQLEKYAPISDRDEFSHKKMVDYFNMGMSARQAATGEMNAATSRMQAGTSAGQLALGRERFAWEKERQSADLLMETVKQAASMSNDKINSLYKLVQSKEVDETSKKAALEELVNSLRTVPSFEREVSDGRGHTQIIKFNPAQLQMEEVWSFFSPIASIQGKNKQIGLVPMAPGAMGVMQNELKRSNGSPSTPGVSDTSATEAILQTGKKVGKFWWENNKRAADIPGNIRRGVGEWDKYYQEMMDQYGSN